MKPKLTSAIARDMASRVEALHDEIARVYADADLNYAGRGNSNVLRDVVKARAELREAEYNASALLESFDAEDA